MGCVHSRPAATGEPGSGAIRSADVASAGCKADALVDNDAHKVQPADAAVQAQAHAQQQLQQSSSGAASCDLGPYRPAQHPVNENDRLNALYATSILDTPTDPRFDDITNLLCNILKMPMSIVSLVDSYRCWLKSTVGLPVNEAPREISICAWTLLPTHPELLVVNDCAADGRFKNCPLVTNPPHIRFYAGAPLITSHGFRLGNLCVMDSKPREFDAEACNLLANFAEIVVRQIERTTMGWSRSYLVNRRAQGLLRALDWFAEGLMLCHCTAAEGRWGLLYVNDAWAKLTGCQSQAAVGADFLAIAELQDSAAEMPRIQEAMRGNRPFSARFVLRDSARKELVVHFKPAHLGQLHDAMPTVGIPSTVPWVPGSGGGMLGAATAATGEAYYFGTMQAADSAAGGGAGGGGRGGAASTSGRGGGELGSARWQWEGQCDDPMRGVVLGPVLGRGSFGKVYRGVWQGTPVAVKVMQFQRSEVEQNKALTRMEAALNLKVSHPHIVPTYKSAARISQAPPMDVPAGSASAARPIEELLASRLEASPPGGHHANSGGSAAGDVGTRRASIESTEHSWGAAPSDSGTEPCSVNYLAGATPAGSSASWAGTATSGRAAEGGPPHHPHANGARASSPAHHQQQQKDGGGDSTSSGSDEGSGKGDSAAAGGGGGKPMCEIWMVMQLCDMGTLIEAAEKGWLRTPRGSTPAAGAPDLAAICETMREVASAMHYLHGRGIVHGDLTGSNVLLTSAGPAAAAGAKKAAGAGAANGGGGAAGALAEPRQFTAKVSDFGLARLLSDGVVNTDTVGTMSHMPPEMLADGELTPAADVYSFGVLLWELFVGERAWAGCHPMHVMFNVAVKRRQLEFPDDANASYVALARACLAADRTQRPAFDEILERLDDILIDELGKTPTL